MTADRDLVARRPLGREFGRERRKLDLASLESGCRAGTVAFGVERAFRCEADAVPGYDDNRFPASLAQW
ncbi:MULTISPECIES: hypothetical protein [Nocardia]|uniref:hypothetical protein n=1 Tax=Nocardia TaxID=1817 RepID=UPI002491FCC7|nr:hypothetical protein [Nocardia sputorum]